MSIPTRAELEAFAREHDGQCKVVRIDVDEVQLIPYDTDPGDVAVDWDYFFTDEADCFNFERFGIVRKRE